MNSTCTTDANGDKQWYLDDNRHREDGPAIEHANGAKHWYLDGQEYSLSEFVKKQFGNTPEASEFLLRYA